LGFCPTARLSCTAAEQAGRHTKAAVGVTAGCADIRGETVIFQDSLEPWPVEASFTPGEIAGGSYTIVGLMRLPPTRKGRSDGPSSVEKIGLYPLLRH